MAATKRRPAREWLDGESADDRRKRLQRERNLRWKQRNPTGNTEASRRWREANPNYVWPARREITNLVRQIKEATPCTDCGNNYPYYVMDFDHLEWSVKVNNVGTMVAHGWSKERILDEIGKCEIVCANCHRIRTWKRKVGTK